MSCSYIEWVCEHEKIGGSLKSSSEDVTFKFSKAQIILFEGGRERQKETERLGPPSWPYPEQPWGRGSVRTLT